MNPKAAEAGSQPKFFSGIKKAASWMGVQTVPPAFESAFKDAPEGALDPAKPPVVATETPSNITPEQPTIVPVEPAAQVPVAEVLVPVAEAPAPIAEVPIEKESSEESKPPVDETTEPTIPEHSPQGSALQAADDSLSKVELVKNFPEPVAPPAPLTPVTRPAAPEQVLPEAPKESAAVLSVDFVESKKEEEIAPEDLASMHLTKDSIFWANPELYKTADGRLDKQKLNQAVIRLKFIQQNPNITSDLESEGISVPKAA